MGKVHSRGREKVGKLEDIGEEDMKKRGENDLKKEVEEGGVWRKRRKEEE